MIKKYGIEVDCAVCAQKVEDAVKNVEGIKDAKVSFINQTMKIEVDENANLAALQKDILKVARKVEPDFEILEK